MTFDRSLLYNFAIQPLRLYSQNFMLIEVGNPFLFELEGIKYSLHISYIHDSGNARTNPDETRIQISRAQIDRQKDNELKGYKARYIGFYPEGDVFTGWDPEKLSAVSATTVTSLYARASDYDAAKQYGAAFYFEDAVNLKRRARHPTMASGALGLYLQNTEFFHTVDLSLTDDKQTAAVRDLLFNHPEYWDEGVKLLKASQLVVVNHNRIKVSVTRTAYPRDPKFSKEVRAAYGHSCSICGRQLMMIEAAHIIPHGHPKSVDDVTNGIALCVEHHKLYDDALIVIDTGRKAYINEKRRKFLQEMNQIQGLQQLTTALAQPYRVPNDALKHPDPDFIRIANSVRLGTKSL